MSVSVTMPMLGESVTEGTVSRWLKQVGDTVVMDEPIVEVSTDKVDTEITAPSAGVILEISAPEDSVIAVGAQLALIGTSDSASAAPAPEPVATAPAETAPVVAAEPQPVAPSPVVEAPAAAAPVASASSAGSTPVVLPALGESVTEGTVTRWLKSVGDMVSVDEPLVEISTDKVDTELPSPAAGVLLEITVGEDQVVAVGGQLGLIGSAAAAPAAAPATPAPVVEPPAAAAPVAVVEASAPAPVAPVVAPTPTPAPPAPTPAPVAAAATPSSSDAYVTPLVRKLAADTGVDLATVSGSGVGGRIRKEDILAAAAAKATAVSAPAAPSAPAAATSAQPSESSALRGTTVKMSRLRKVIAERMVESLATSAQLTTVVEVDVTRISQLRDRVKGQFEANEGVKLSFLPFFAKATIEALKQYPQVNASIDMEQGTITYPDAEHLGIAVDTDRGLLVPVIRDAGDLSIGGLARKIADVAGRTRTNKVSPDELSGGTFTLTNTGSRGALFDTPIINQPQVAILSIGAIIKRPVVINDMIAIRPLVQIGLTFDHRVVDGEGGARYLAYLKETLENFDESSL